MLRSVKYISNLVGRGSTGFANIADSMMTHTSVTMIAIEAKCFLLWAFFTNEVNIEDFVFLFFVIFLPRDDVVVLRSCLVFFFVFGIYK